MRGEQFVRRCLTVSLVAGALIGAGACAPEEDFSQPIPDQPITQTEQAEGVSETGQDYAEPTDSTDGDVATLAPPADERTADDGSGTATVTSGSSACRTATGYVRGRAITICVTTIDGHLVEIHTAQAYLRMRAAASRAGVSLHIVSGFRTMAQQRYLYNLYLSGRGNLAARPGYSNHQSGHALDLNTSAGGVSSWLARHGDEYGVRRTVPSEVWHWEHW